MKTTFRFLAPDNDGNLIDIDLIADELPDAFNTLATEHLSVGGIRRAARPDSLCWCRPWNTGARPKLIEFQIQPSFPRTFACGD